MIDKFRGEYSFLSNMYPVTLRINGERYPSAEHAFQAMKCLDSRDRLAISLCRSPKEAKEAGKHVSLRPDWEHVKVDLMLEILQAKFQQNSDLGNRLKDTGDQYLVEYNTWGDNFWGVCNGAGQNILGVLLMNVRDRLNQAEASL